MERGKSAMRIGVVSGRAGNNEQNDVIDTMPVISHTSTDIFTCYNIHMKQSNKSAKQIETIHGLCKTALRSQTDLACTCNWGNFGTLANTCLLEKVEDRWQRLGTLCTI